MKIWTRTVLCLVAACAVSPGAAAAASAPEAAGYDDCPQGRMCIWHERDGGGARLSFAHKARDLTELEGHMNDHVLSAWNRTKRRWCFYEHARFKGDRRAAQPEPLVWSKGNTNEFGYKISSLKPC
ncbi:peptidase inhibitor family I36 protein [Actinomadura roseirufa]|uniref:peptidase inhibitor family I36 protein n=1 Tax=Actinomadura roseirufa TaxID=2094049 RepID=UPI001041AFA6|nr:peptidase inhibitor family I36 protein [Actinomadura roseirufa]